MPTLFQHFQRIDTKFGLVDAELDTKIAIPTDGGTFNPAAIDLTQGQIEYDAYTQTGPINCVLFGTPTIGGVATVNIRGGGFPINFPATFVGLEGLTTGTVLTNGVSYPFYFRAAIDWIEVSPGVFQDRVLVGAIGITSSGGLRATNIITGAHNAQPGTLVLTDSSSGGFQVTLPGAPTHGDAVGFLDVAPPASGWAVNTVTILRNGKSIGGVLDDILLDQDVRRLDLVFVAADNDWVASYTATTTAPAAAAAATVVPIVLADDTDATVAHAGPDRVLVTDVGTPVTLTLRTFATVPIPLHSVINLDRRGTGDFIIAAGAGVILKKPADRLARLRTAESSAVLYHDPLNTWRLRGDLSEV